MKVVKVGIDKIIPYARNPRKNDLAVDKVAASIKEFGFRQPIVVDTENVIIAGHTRYMAAKKLQMNTIPVHIAEGLTPQQVKAYRIADNRVSQESEWDYELLKLELPEIDGLFTGFDQDEIDELLKPEFEGLTDEDAVPDVPDDAITKEGDIWLLGNHRLMCGDSTKIDQVERLMDGQKADMVFTDPPYNIDYIGVSDKRDRINNDKMDDVKFIDFLVESLMGCETMYVCCSWQNNHLFRQAMINIARKPKAMIVWNKVNPAQHLDKYYKQHELIYYYGDFGGHKTLRGDVWQLKRERNTVHPTMKPVELIEMALLDQEGKTNVYDGFAGSGSTMIACEKLRRNSYLMETEPLFCDVIVNRWQDFTGKEAVLENTNIKEAVNG